MEPTYNELDLVVVCLQSLLYGKEIFAIQKQVWRAVPSRQGIQEGVWETSSSRALQHACTSSSTTAVVCSSVLKGLLFFGESYEDMSMPL